MTPTEPTAPRSRARRVWSHAWRLLLALAFGGLMSVGTYRAPGALQAEITLQPTAGTWFWADVACLLVCAPLYVLRHRAPLLVTGVVVALGSFSFLSAGLVVLAVVSIATRRRWVEIGAVYALWLASSLVGERALSQWVIQPEVLGPSDAVMVVSQAGTAALLVVTGMFIGGRRALIASLREQAATARREADARGQTARAAERNRIAREMHDVLAHRLSLVALHSGALEYRAGLDPDQVRETAAVVRANAHDALGELREVLGLLRESTPGGEEHSRPQPTFAQVDDLLEGTRAAGTPVTLVLDHVEHDDLTHLPVTTSRHLYRLVQETLTNARKHAPGQPVTVRLHGTPGERLTLTVTNPVPATAPTTPLPSSGWGLTGLAERVRLTGGHLDAHLTPDGTFTVDAWLPWATTTTEAPA
ncbi:integral membrane sensor signal transduction histidine kinase [Cellulomonas flavigena DSM 20109]|uniref:histidine kinase n=1 Tax=Cellulomonas flavigena (strain ATCC 482 / DSM 20109 / BCRC 11376 / JCM 18109 / NBRC 3775 / NCIMB 8073 / NRS 134) TaxID=446466 RepID=D5UJZ1_CELFN|nr:histidine kinase [Cellulomonas flavigena]ADG73733.1 integral membrane sensor signal transduction histidine kinase [Cellulomonas flavigena DSM 20109]